MDSGDKKRSDVDRGWAWVILFASALSNFLIGILGAVGLFNVIFLDVFQGSKASTSVVGALASGLLLLLGPVSSAITNKFGPRVSVMLGGLLASLGTFASFFATSLFEITIAFGFLLGTGLGLVYTASNVVLSFYFEKYRIPVYGFVTMSVGVGCFFFALIMNSCMEAFTWRGAMLICSGFFLNLLVTGALMRPVEVRENGLKAKSEKACSKIKEYFDVELLWNKPFILYWFSLLLSNIALPTIIVHLPASAIEMGSTFAQSSTLVSVYSFANILSRGSTGIIANCPRVNMIALYSSTILISGILLCLAPLLLPTFTGQIIFTALFAYFSNVFAVLMAPMAIDIVGLDKIGSAFGLMSFACGLGYTFGPIIGGLLYDAMGSYDNIFYISGVLFILSCILALLIPLVKKYERTFDLSEEELYSAPDENEGTKRSLYQANMSKFILHGSSLLYIPSKHDNISMTSSQRHLSDIAKRDLEFCSRSSYDIATSVKGKHLHFDRIHQSCGHINLHSPIFTKRHEGEKGALPQSPLTEDLIGSVNEALHESNEKSLNV